MYIQNIFLLYNERAKLKNEQKPSIVVSDVDIQLTKD